MALCVIGIIRQGQKLLASCLFSTGADAACQGLRQDPSVLDRCGANRAKAIDKTRLFSTGVERTLRAMAFPKTVCSRQVQDNGCCGQRRHAGAD